MTTYTNNSRMGEVDAYIEAAPWWKGKVIGKAGTFPMDSYPDAVKHIQFETVLAQAANIKKGLNKEFPAASDADLKVMLRTLHYFTGLLSLTDGQYSDLSKGDRLTVEKMKQKIDALDYQFDQDSENWVVGYATTFTSDPDYSEFWIPWFKARAGSGSTISNPADINIKVTNIAGTTGTEGTILSMATVLTSTTTGMTQDFVNLTFGPIIRAFSAVVDTNNGRRMVDTSDAYTTTARFSFLGAAALLDELENTHPYDGEKLNMEISIADQMRAKKIELIPCEDFTASMIEDGACQFGFIADFQRNFKLGVSDPVTFEAWKELPAINSQWVRKMWNRWTAISIPYFDGTYFRKAFFHGTFVYKSDVA
jgi:hypothetical protein